MNSPLNFSKEFIQSSGITMCKVRDSTDASVYACEIATLLREKRYLVALVVYDTKPLGTQVSFDNLLPYMFAIQFRSITNGGSFPGVTISKTLEEILHPCVQRILIKRVRIEKDNDVKNSIYDSVTPNGTKFKVTLFHTGDSDFEYVSEGSLNAAIATFNTLIEAEE